MNVERRASAFLRAQRAPAARSAPKTTQTPPDGCDATAGRTGRRGYLTARYDLDDGGFVRRRPQRGPDTLHFLVGRIGQHGNIVVVVGHQQLLQLGSRFSPCSRLLPRRKASVPNRSLT